MKSKLSSTIIKLLLGIALFFVIERFCHKQTRGFTLPNIYTEKSFVTMPAESMTNEMLALFSQPFTFLNSGLECYAFLSQDKKIVLKVFKHHYIRQAEFVAQLLPLPYFQKLRQDKIERMAKTFASCKIAYEELKDETGLLYMHLNKTSLQLPTITLIDKLGIKHQVALDGVQFMVQKRADLLDAVLENTMAKQDLEGAKKHIHALVALIVDRCKKGVADRDPILDRNFGFLEDRAIVIDVGSFSKNSFLESPQAYKRELFYETLPLRCLLTKRFPELLPAFEAEFNRVIASS